MLKEDVNIQVISQMCGNPIMCCESALYQLGLSTYVDRHLTFLNKYQSVNTAEFEYIKETRDFKDIIISEKGYRVTSPERTLCDMIAWDRCEEFLVQGLDDYMFDYSERIPLLLEKAKEYNVYDKLMKYIDELNNTEEFY